MRRGAAEARCEAWYLAVKAMAAGAGSQDYYRPTLTAP